MSNPIFQQAEKAKAEAEEQFFQQLPNRKIIMNGTEYTATSTMLANEENDETFVAKKQAYTQCTDQYTMKYTAIGAAAAIPVSLLFRTYWPLFLFTVAASGYELYHTYVQCLPVRNALDEYMLVRRKIELERKRVMLQAECDVLEQDFFKRKAEREIVKE